MLKKILSWVLVITLTAGIAVGGTLAYLTDRDSKANVFTVGDVSIKLEEDFDQGAELIPGVDIEKKPTITNTGKNDAWVWLEFAIPSALDNWALGTQEGSNENVIHWNQLGATTEGYVTDARVEKAIADGHLPEGTTVDSITSVNATWNLGGKKEFSRQAEIEVDGEKVKYNIYVIGYNKTLAPGEETLPNIFKVFLDARVDITPEGDWYFVENGVAKELNWNTETNGAPVIYVSAYAMQAEGFANVDEAIRAYNTQWGDNGGEYAKPVIPGAPVMAPADAVKVYATTTYEEFAQLVSEGKNINIVEDVTIANSESSRFTEFTVNGNVGIYSDTDSTLTFAETTTFVGDGTVTVYRGSIVENQELCIQAKMVIEGGEHTFNAFSATMNGEIVVNGGTLNCMGTYGGVLGISLAENGSVTINDGTLNMYQPFNLNANRCDNAYIEINGGNINLDANVDKLFAVRNIMDKDRTSGVLRGSSIKITGGVFNAPYPMDDTGDANAFIRNEDGNCDTTRVLTGNTYNGEKQYNCVVTGGTFYGCWTRTGETGGDGTEVCENTIAGFVADGYQMTGDAANGYTVTAN